MALRIGDKVIITRFNGQEIRHEANIMKIIEFGGITSFLFSPSVIGNYGGSYFSSNHGDTYELPETKKHKFKVGDRFKQVKGGNNPSSIGEIIEITRLDPEDTSHYFSKGNYGWTEDYLEENYVLIDSEKPDKLEQPEELKELSASKDYLADLGSIFYTLPSFDPVSDLYYWVDGSWILGEISKSSKLINKDKKMNKSIIEFAKNLTLTKEEKLLRKAGLKDNEGDWTGEARAIVTNKRAKEMGFKNFEELYKNIGSGTISAIEFVQMFQKYEADLIKIAVEFEKENKKK